MSYDIEGLKAAWPNLPKNPLSDGNPTLREFLEHGYLSDLCAAVLTDALPDPWKTRALICVPPAAMVAAIAKRDWDFRMAKREITNVNDTTSVMKLAEGGSK